MTTQGATGSSSKRALMTEAASARAVWSCKERTPRSTVDRMRKPETRRHPSGDADRPVGSRRDDPVDALGAGEAVDRRLVLGGDERALVRERESGRRRIAIDSDHEELALAGGAQKADLRRPRP